MVVQTNNYPRAEDGEPDFEVMVEQLGLSNDPAKPLFVAAQDGTVFEVESHDSHTGLVRLRMAHGEMVEQDLLDLWEEWDDLDIRYRRYLRNDQVVIDRMTLAVLVDHAEIEADELNGWTLRGAPQELSEAIAATREVLDG